MVKFTAYVCLLAFVPAALFSDLNKDMNRFFNSFGSSANVNAGGIYEGQKAGYMTGGGLTIRNQSINTNVAHVDLPQFDAGCGGIDIYAGGFSFLEGKEIVESLKRIGAASASYAFLLGLETVSPQISNNIKQLQGWANDINRMNINSCEVASQMVGSVWPKDTMAKQQICKSISGKEGLFTDAAASRQKCAQKEEYGKQIKYIEEKPEYKDLLVGNYNIAWEAIQKQGFLKKDKARAEIFMSLMGTVVVTEKGDGTIDHFLSKVKEQAFVNTILRGGETKIYQCQDAESKLLKLDEKKCLVVKEVLLSIDKDNSWTGKIHTILKGVETSIGNDEEISDDATELLTKTSLPLYKIVNVLTAYKHKRCPIDMYQVSDIVGMDMLVQYLREAVEVVRNGAFQARSVQMYGDKIDEYLRQLDSVEATIREYEVKTSRLMEREFQMMQRIQMYEDKIASEIRLG
jgi:conjugative transfer pilus assembly protein TraH